ncbi:conserved hypothetical protein [Vibrio chagasii]|nr:conserved hypothetical protein [Vibrio chagasii]
MRHIYADNILKEGNSDIESIVKQVDLDWEIVQAPCFYRDPISHELVKTEDYFALKKQGDIVTRLSLTGGDFVPLSPRTLFEIIMKIAHRTMLEIKAAGHTREGKYIYALCEMPEASHVHGVSFKNYLLISSSNEKNQKTRLTPVCISEHAKIQLPVLMTEKPDESSITISHHYTLDADEVAFDILERFRITQSDYFSTLDDFSKAVIDDKLIGQFHHNMYRRFKVGKSVKKEYESAMIDLMSCHETFEQTLSQDMRSTVLSLWLSFNYYFDNLKSRRGGTSGKIHSINFGMDEKTKREAYNELLKLYAKLK